MLQRSQLETLIYQISIGKDIPSKDCTYKNSEEFCTTLLDCVSDQGLEQLVHFPMRKDNIFDLFFTSNPTLIDSIKPIPGISDHDNIIMVSFKLSESTKNHGNIKRPITTRCEKNSIRIISSLLGKKILDQWMRTVQTLRTN